MNTTQFAEELKEAIQNGASISDIVQMLEDWTNKKIEEVNTQNVLTHG